MSRQMFFRGLEGFLVKTFVLLTALILGATAPLSAQPESAFSHYRLQELLTHLDSTSNALEIDEDALTAGLCKQIDVRQSEEWLEHKGSLAITVSSVGCDQECRRQEVCQRLAQSAIAYANQDRIPSINEGELDRLISYRFGSPIDRDLSDLLGFSYSKGQIAAADTKITESLIDRWTDTEGNFQLHLVRSYLDSKLTDKPATIAWNEFGDDDETLADDRRRTNYDFRGALYVELMQNATPSTVGSLKLVWAPVVVYEADVSTDAAVGRDLITHRVGSKFTLFPSEPGKIFSGHNFDLTVDYKTDRDYRSDVYGATFQYFPNLPRAGVGRSLFAGSFRFTWQPYVGLVYSDVQDAGEIATLQDVDGSTEATGRLTAEIGLGARFVLTAEGLWTWELENDDEKHLLRTFQARYLLDEKERTSLTVTYVRGESSPGFLHKDQIQIGIGIKL